MSDTVTISRETYELLDKRSEALYYVRKWLAANGHMDIYDNAIKLAKDKIK